jgi:hypothetical protein
VLSDLGGYESQAPEEAGGDFGYARPDETSSRYD